MANLTEFQREKLTVLFQRFYDSNKNGVVTKSDFIDLLKELQTLRKWAPGDPRLAKAKAALNGAWMALKKGADADHDQKVTMDEWMEYWGGLVSRAGAGYPAEEGWVKEYADFWFELMDTSGDDVVDENEFAQVCRQFGAEEAEARAAFNKFALKPVDREYYEELWLEYITSDDKAAPGNYVFGKAEW